MRQVGYQPYLDFVERTPTMLDMSSEVTKIPLDHVAGHQHTTVTEADPMRLYDEFNATIYGHYASGKVESLLKYLQEAFYDFSSYSAELSDIHAQFRRENGGARQAETLRERQDQVSRETFGVDLETLEEAANLWEDALRAGRETTLQAGERNGRMGATRNSLKEGRGAWQNKRSFPTPSVWRRLCNL